MPDEFSLIEKYFSWKNIPKSVALGIGDDAAILSLPENKQLVTSIDTLIEGIHFPKETDAHAIAHKALAINLSDLAAMGADPAWFTLSLSLPDNDETWLQEFSEGLKALAQQYDIFLVGGDTTRGALSITIQVMGFVEKDQVMLRSGANHHDKIYVTGTLGDAAAGLAALQGELYFEPNDTLECVSKLEYPQPCNHISRIIRSYASACIDISDGTLADLQHILDASSVGAIINTDKIPLSPILQKLDRNKALELALSGGDDYQLLFTLPPVKAYQLSSIIERRKLAISCIGSIDKSVDGIKLVPELPLAQYGYKHFT